MENILKTLILCQYIIVAHNHQLYCKISSVLNVQLVFFKVSLVSLDNIAFVRFLKSCKTFRDNSTCKFMIFDVYIVIVIQVYKLNIFPCRI